MQVSGAVACSIVSALICPCVEQPVKSATDAAAASIDADNSLFFIFILSSKRIAISR
jgi:hypothetical protein